MLTLDNLLTASRAKSSDEDKLRHAISCSPFLTRLCTKHAGLVQDLLENHKLAYQLADMQKFLAEQTIFDEKETLCVPFTSASLLDFITIASGVVFSKLHVFLSV